MPASVPYRSSDALSASAYQWLQQYHESFEPPIPIEEILEFSYGVTPFPIPGLEYAYAVVGTLGAGFDTLYVDEWVMMKQPGRYRLTVAHEIAHIVLHHDVLSEWDAKWQATSNQDIDAWVRLQQDMDTAMLKRMESQAFLWAQHVLVPTQPLVASVDLALLDYDRADQCLVATR